MPWIDSQAPPGIKKPVRRGKKIKWSPVVTDNLLDLPQKYIIYVNEIGANFNQDDPRFIYTILNKDEIKYKFKRINRKRKKYQVRISVVDRLNNESRPSEPVIVKL
jgi:hypothetical protein